MFSHGRVPFCVVCLIAAAVGGFTLGYVLRGPGEEQRLIAKEKRALMRKLQRKPADPDVLRRLANVCLAQGRLDEARGYAEQAVSADANNPTNWQTYGEALYNIFETRCSKASAQRFCESVRNQLGAAGRALLRICESLAEEDELDITYLVSAERFLRTAGEKEAASRAYHLAIQTAEHWSQSESSVERMIGRFYLEQLQTKETDREHRFFWKVK